MTIQIFKSSPIISLLTKYCSISKTHQNKSSPIVDLFTTNIAQFQKHTRTRKRSNLHISSISLQPILFNFKNHIHNNTTFHSSDVKWSELSKRDTNAQLKLSYRSANSKIANRSIIGYTIDRLIPSAPITGVIVRHFFPQIFPLAYIAMFSMNAPRNCSIDRRDVFFGVDILRLAIASFCRARNPRAERVRWTGKASGWRERRASSVRGYQPFFDVFFFVGWRVFRPCARFAAP